jgi:hypothetical protein
MNDGDFHAKLSLGCFPSNGGISRLAGHSGEKYVPKEVQDPQGQQDQDRPEYHPDPVPFHLALLASKGGPFNVVFLYLMGAGIGRIGFLVKGIPPAPAANHLLAMGTGRETLRVEGQVGRANLAPAGIVNETRVFLGNHDQRPLLG